MISVRSASEMECRVRVSVRAGLVLLAYVLCVHRAVALPDGAPEDACGTMTPEHPNTAPQTRPAPFSIILSQETYIPGDTIGIRVTIKMTEPGRTFKGFMILTRRMDTENRTLGSFRKIPGTKHVCSTAGLTHTAGNPSGPMRELTVEWNPPSSTQSPINIQFRVTIVVDFQTYWVDERSQILYDRRSTRAVVVTPSTPRTFVTDITQGCGVTKGCYRNPPNCREESCDIVATWRHEKDHVEFELSADTDGWVALGLSDDKLMGNDDVMECAWNKSKAAVDVRQSINKDKTNHVLPRADLPHVEWSRSKGRLRCQFYLNKANSVLLDRLNHLLLAKGPVSDTGTKLRHSLETNKYPYISPNKVHILGKKVDLTYTARDPLVKAHGCLMLIGWMMCASTAILLAKYYKRMWPNSRLCGVEVWFAVHRGLMIACLVCTVIAFILIFVHVGGYSKMPDYPEKAHPPLGICVMILCLLNAILAIFHCKPTSRCRPIFNWFHWLFGTVAYVLQMPAIFIGLNLHKAFVPSWATWIITAFVLFHLIIELLLEIHGCLNAKKQQRRDDDFGQKVKLDFKGDYHNFKEEPVGHHFKKIIITLYLIVVIVLGIVMVIAVAAG
jgi:hypothetical protein